MRWLVYPLLVLIGPAAAAACPSDLSTLSHDGPVTMTVCPAGDGQSLAEVGSIATVTVLDRDLIQRFGFLDVAEAVAAGAVCVLTSAADLRSGPKPASRPP